MSKKHRKSIPVQQTQKEKGFIIDQNKFNKKKAYFKTGAHKTAKDKPRKRYKRTDNWEDNYEL